MARCISAAKTLAAWECGAIGPDKDCGYEGPIVKAIAGMPISQEGKNCQCAHCDLQGNLMAQTCDLWSNESVEYHPEFGGSSVQCWLGALGYEAALMNTALQLKQEKTLRDLYMFSDRFRGPEAYVLAYDNAYRIGQAIVAEGDNIYNRALAAGLAGSRILLEGYKKKEIMLTNKQYEVLLDIIGKFESLPAEEDDFVEFAAKEYRDVPNFNMKNYGL